MRNNQQEVVLVRALPPVLSFKPYKHPRPPYKRILNLPLELFSEDNRVHDLDANHRITQSLADLFMLFFDEVQFANLTRNTNAYARVKEAGRDGA